MEQPGEGTASSLFFFSVFLYRMRGLRVLLHANIGNVPYFIEIPMGLIFLQPTMHKDGLILGGFYFFNLSQRSKNIWKLQGTYAFPVSF